MWKKIRIEKHAYIEILDDFTYSMIILKHQETFSQIRYQKMVDQNAFKKIWNLFEYHAT